MKNFVFISVLILGIVSCTETVTEEKTAQIAINIDKGGVEGNYVDAHYQNRNEGYDWVAVCVYELDENSVSISIRSRADKKKPTCTFDAKGFKIDENTYESFVNGKSIIYSFNDSSITISSKNKEDEDVLFFYCSGGATFAGTYDRLYEPIDQNQIDQTVYSDVLSIQGVGFTVSSVKSEEGTELNVATYGLQEREYIETIDIGDFHVVHCETEDMNLDGSPELLIFTQSNSTEKKGMVYAYSVNSKKSMSMVFFKPTSENKKINSGYKGGDEFSMMETKLGQRFPIYKTNDKIGSPTGGTRQVSYKLVEGEAMRKLEVDKVIDF